EHPRSRPAQARRSARDQKSISVDFHYWRLLVFFILSKNVDRSFPLSCTLYFALPNRQGFFCFYAGVAIKNFASPRPTFVQTLTASGPGWRLTNSRDQSGAQRAPKRHRKTGTYAPPAASIGGVTPIASLRP